MHSNPLKSKSRPKDPAPRRKYTSFEAVARDHEKLVLDYQQKDAFYREAVNDPNITEEEVEQRSFDRRSAFQELFEFEKFIGKDLISKAYKQTNKVNYIERPDLSPFAYSSKGRQVHYQESKSVLAQHFKALRGRKCDLKLQDDRVPLHVAISANVDGEEIFRFIAAAAIDLENKPVLIFFHYWKVSKTMLEGLSPVWQDVAEQNFAVPLAIQPASVNSGKLFLAWILEVISSHLGMEFSEEEDLAVRYIQSLSKLRPDLPALRQQFPEMAHVLPLRKDE